MRGRKPVPTKLRALRGNPRKRSLPKDPVPPTGELICPAWLTAVPFAAEFWNQELPKLQFMDVVTTADFVQLCGMALNYSLIRMLARDMAEEEFRTLYLKVTVDGAGQEHQEIKPHPVIDKVKALTQNLQRLGSDYGMNPSSRARLGGIGRKKERTPLQQFRERARQLRAVAGGKKR